VAVCGPNNPEDALGQLLLEAASFDKIQPAIDAFGHLWSMEDSGTIVDLAAAKVKPKLEDLPEDSCDAKWDDDDDDCYDAKCLDGSAFNRR
jgi:hypothetical protein